MGAPVTPLLALAAAALSAAGFLGYVFVYTIWLKRSTPQNIVIGGAAGAVPPLVAWAAVTEGLSGTALYLFAIVFFWTPPHFWALSLLMKDEYAKAGVPMLPAVASLRTTAVRILGYTLVLWALTVVFAPVAGMGSLYLVAAVALGAVFTVFALRLLRTEADHEVAHPAARPDPHLGQPGRHVGLGDVVDLARAHADLGADDDAARLEHAEQSDQHSKPSVHVDRDERFRAHTKLA